VHAKFPGKLLSYNCSPSFNWRKNLSEEQIATFQQVRLGSLTIHTLCCFCSDFVKPSI